MKRSPNGAAAALQVADDLIPIGELKAHLSEKIRSLQDRGRPLVVTQNGKAAAVMLSPGDFDRLTSQARFIAAVQEGLEDGEAGRWVSNEELDRELDAEFGPLPATP